MGNKQNAKISFFAAECMEFPDFGEMNGGLSLPEAVDAYKRICRNNRSYGPGIGFVLRDPKIPEYADICWPLYQCGRIAAEEIWLVPAYREHPLVKAAVQEMENYLPGIKRTGKQGRGMER